MDFLEEEETWSSEEWDSEGKGMIAGTRRETTRKKRKRIP
jgi:hypothetical protein